MGDDVQRRLPVEACWHWRRTAVVAEGGHSSAGVVDVDNRSGAAVAVAD